MKWPFALPWNEVLTQVHRLSGVSAGLTLGCSRSCRFIMIFFVIAAGRRFILFFFQKSPLLPKLKYNMSLTLQQADNLVTKFIFIVL